MSGLNTLIEQLKSNTFPEKESYRQYLASTFSDSLPFFLWIYLGLSDLLYLPWCAITLAHLIGAEYCYDINKNGDNKDFFKANDMSIRVHIKTSGLLCSTYNTYTNRIH